jgi:hypothetical protein
MLFTSHNTPHITLGNEQCLKLLLGVCIALNYFKIIWSLTTFAFPVVTNKFLFDGVRLVTFINEIKV